MGIEEKLSKGELYELIVKKPRFSSKWMENPDFEIKKEDSDQIYQRVKAFERNYAQDECRSRYYSDSLKQIEKGYVSGNFELFEKGVKNLMGDIDAE